MPIFLKYLITAAIVVLVSEVAKRSDKIGALIAALPVVTSIVMLWMFIELKGEEQVERIGSHAWYTFWYVIPTLPMFLVIPVLLKRGMHFGWVMAIYSIGSIILFLIMHVIMKKFGFPLI